jgi:hypothetical protein
MSVLEIVQRYRAEQQRGRRQSAIRADLIPRAHRDDERYAGVDLVARGRDLSTLSIGIARLELTPDDLSGDTKAAAQRIGEELKAAGLEEVCRWATDVLFAYSDIPNIAPATETAMFYAWSLSIEGGTP